MGIPCGQKKANILQEQFHKHFGSSPLDIVECWYDLCVYDQSALSPKEKSDKGFKQFLAAQYWLWAKPKNAEMFASRFGMSVSYVRGKKLWLWIERIANLSKKKIVWGKSVDSKKPRFMQSVLMGLILSCGNENIPNILLTRRQCLTNLTVVGRSI